MDELGDGIRRVTLPLPTRPGHVHAYLLPGDEGWTLVDTGIGLPDAKASWALELAQAGGTVATVFITHFHPDHAGGGEDAQRLTGAQVLQGSADYEQCERVWGSDDWSSRLADYLQSNGLPDEVAAEVRAFAELGVEDLALGFNGLPADEVVAGACLTHDGEIRNERAKSVVEAA